MPVTLTLKNQRTIKDKLLEALRQFPFYLRALRLIWGATQRLTLAWAILLLIQGLLPAASVYLTKMVVDSLVVTIEAGFSWVNLQPLAILASLMAAILLLTEILGSLLGWIRTAQSEYIQDHITTLIHQKSAAVDLAFYESPEYYDHLQRAQSDASTRSLALLESSGSLFQNTITLLAMAGIFLPYGAWLPVLLFVG
ncbi:MAG TPA: ABC transporter ATP-binding protein, partial [bacterium]|nr:ABC transporter ATP-binding protein [bacterium]